MMKSTEVLKILTQAIPRSVSWSTQEPYGGYGIDLDKDIKKILYCVTATEEVVKYFHDGGYDLLVSHHPFRAKDVPQIVLHTALDCCDGGLNDMWRDALEIQDAQHFDRTLGWYGKIEPISYVDLCTKIEKFTGYPIIGQKYTQKDTIDSLVVCSGLGGIVNTEALKTGADCYIIGEATRYAEDSGFKAVVETGHTNSEWIGVKLIKKLLEPDVIVDGAPTNIDVFNNEVFVDWHNYRQYYTN